MDISGSSPVYVPVGQDLTLSCEYEAVPAPTITWFQGVTELNASDSRITIRSNDTHSDFTLSSIQSDEGGVYTCEASNVVDSNDSAVTIIVQGKQATGHGSISTCAYTHVCTLYDN